MMGDYSGNALLFEITKEDTGEYNYHVETCAFVPLQLLSVIAIALASVLLGLFVMGVAGVLFPQMLQKGLQ